MRTKTSKLYRTYRRYVYNQFKVILGRASFADERVRGIRYKWWDYDSPVLSKRCRDRFIDLAKFLRLKWDYPKYGMRSKANVRWMRYYYASVMIPDEPQETEMAREWSKWSKATRHIVPFRGATFCDVTATLYDFGPNYHQGVVADKLQDDGYELIPQLIRMEWRV